MLSVPQDELSSQFFNFNHQQCFLNQLKNYWHKTVFPTEQPHQSPGEKNPLAPPHHHHPQDRLAPRTHPFSSLGQFLIFNQSYLFWCLISTSKFREAHGLGIDRNEFICAGSSTHQQENMHLLFLKSPVGINDNCQSLRKCYNPMGNVSFFI